VDRQHPQKVVGDKDACGLLKNCPISRSSTLTMPGQRRGRRPLKELNRLERAHLDESSVTDAGSISQGLTNLTGCFLNQHQGWRQGAAEPQGVKEPFRFWP